MNQQTPLGLETGITTGIVNIYCSMELGTYVKLWLNGPPSNAAHSCHSPCFHTLFF